MFLKVFTNSRSAAAVGAGMFVLLVTVFPFAKYNGLFSITSYGFLKNTPGLLFYGINGVFADPVDCSLTKSAINAK